MLARSPGFAAVAVLSLALGIGANITMFSVVNGVLLRPLPFEDSDRLVIVRQGTQPTFSYPDFLDWRGQNQIFEDLSAYTAALFELVERDGARKIDGARVSGDFFPMLKVSAYLGRTFAKTDELENTELVAVISHDLWQSHFGRDTEILGSSITLNGLYHRWSTPPRFPLPRYYWERPDMDLTEPFRGTTEQQKLLLASNSGTSQGRSLNRTGTVVDKRKTQTNGSSIRIR
jgi:hypothetical protein